MPQSTRILLLLLPFAAAACALDLTAPQPSLEGLPAGLSVSLAVEPGEVSQHEPFTVQLDVTNTTDDTIRVVTSHGCLALPHVLRDGKRVSFKGSAWGCTAAITTHTFAPGETTSRTWQLRAELYAQHPGDVEGAPAPKGTYRVQAEFDTYSETAPFQKPAIERELRVR